MRLFFICSYAVAVYADLFAHVRMKLHRKIRKFTYNKIDLLREAVIYVLAEFVR